MMRHPSDDRLRRWRDAVRGDAVDDQLEQGERDAIAAHVASCGECRARQAALDTLADRLQGLPRDIEPPVDLWPSIRAAINATVTSAPPVELDSLAAAPADGAISGATGGSSVRLSRPARLRDVLPRLLVAAAAMLLLASSLMLIVGSDVNEPHLVSTPSPDSRFAALEQAYLVAAAELLAALERDRGSLPADVEARLDGALAVIDAAVRETRAALAADPDNRDLAEMTLAAQRRKLEFLQRVADWSSGT